MSEPDLNRTSITLIRRPPRDRRPPRWPSGKASASRAEGPGFESRLRRVFFRGRVTLVTFKLALQWLPCQSSGVFVSALELVGPVSVYCDWVRWKVGSATAISVWQHVKLSEQIRPRDTLACCWDVKQPTNQPTTAMTMIMMTMKSAIRDFFFFFFFLQSPHYAAKCLQHARSSGQFCNRA